MKCCIQGQSSYLTPVYKFLYRNAQIYLLGGSRSYQVEIKINYPAMPHIHI